MKDKDAQDVGELSDNELVAEITGILLRVINRVQRDRPRRYSDSLSMSLVEMEICQRIHRRPGISAIELSDKLAVSRSAMSQTLARLRDRGLIAEQPDQANRRRKLLTLTAAGEEAMRAATRANELLAEDVYGEPRAELESYHRFVRKLEDAQLKAAAAFPDEPDRH